MPTLCTAPSPASAPPAAQKFERAEEPRKPAVPKRSDMPLHGLKSEKDFVTANAVDAILAVPRRRTQEEENWFAKPDFGKVPGYLDRVKKEIESEHEYIQSLLDQQQMEEEASSGVAMRELSMDEREELLAGLKAKWDEVSKWRRAGEGATAQGAGLSAGRKQKLLGVLCLLASGYSPSPLLPLPFLLSVPFFPSAGQPCLSENHFQTHFHSHLHHWRGALEGDVREAADPA